MKIHSNPPLLYYGFKWLNMCAFYKMTLSTNSVGAIHIKFSNHILVITFFFFLLSKRGRPPKNRPVAFNVPSTQAKQSNSVSFHSGTATNNGVGNAGEQNKYVSIQCYQGENNVGGDAGPSREEEDKDKELSPAVRSARLAFSRALQNSCRALSYQPQEPSTNEHDPVLQDESMAGNALDPQTNETTPSEMNSTEQGLTEDYDQSGCRELQTSDSELFSYESSAEQVPINHVAVLNNVFQDDVQRLQFLPKEESSVQEQNVEDTIGWVTVEPDFKEEDVSHMQQAYRCSLFIHCYYYFWVASFEEILKRKAVFQRKKSFTICFEKKSARLLTFLMWYTMIHLNSLSQAFELRYQEN